MGDNQASQVQILNVKKEAMQRKMLQCYNLFSLKYLQMIFFLGLKNLWQGQGGNDQVRKINILTPISITSSVTIKNN